jgi:DNA replication protein DnaC
MTAREVDVHKLPALLTALRLPSFQVHWQDFAERADPLAQDRDGWSAAKFLAALAECELAERETRRIQRHLAEARLPGGKTLATFDFKMLPDLRKWGCGDPTAPHGGAASKRSPPATGSTAAPT